jgi:AraC-like DNA-binding protein
MPPRHGAVDSTSHVTDGTYSDEEGAVTQQDLQHLQGVYLDAYNAIVEPHRIFPVHSYTLRRWVPILGASGFWLLIAFQQACFRNEHGNDWCVTSRENLAEEAGLSRTTVHRYIRDDDYQKYKLTRWVFPPSLDAVSSRRRWSSSAHRMIQAPNRYQVLLDPPLTQKDQKGLAHLLIDAGQDGLAQLLEQIKDKNFTERLELLSKAAAEADDWNIWAPTPQVIAETIWTDLSKDDLERLNDLYQLIQGPVKLFPQYFRQHWLPKLGPKKALIYIQLRSRCFLSATEERNEIEISYTTLARESGCSSGWLRKNADFDDRFYTVQSRGRGRSPKFTVQLRVPLAPEHQGLYEKMLQGQKLDEGGQWTLPLEDENGSSEPLGTQRTDLVNPSERENGSSEPLGMAKNGPSEPLGTQRTDLMNRSDRENGSSEPLRAEENGPSEPLGTQRTDLVNRSDRENGSNEPLGMAKNGPGEPLGTQRTDLVNRIINTYVINTSKDYITLEKQQHDNVAAVIDSLFGAFGITGHQRLRAQYAHSFPVIQAWMLYSLTGSFDNPQGFVVAKLRAGESPPARFKMYAHMEPDQWQGAWRAGHYGGAYRNVNLPVDSDAWWSDFAGVFENGPFGRGPVTPAEVEVILANIGHDGASVHVEQDWIEVTGVPLEQSEEIKAALESHGIHHRVEILPETEVDEVGDEVWPSWTKILEELSAQMTQATFYTHLANSVARKGDGRVTILVPSKYTVDWLDTRLRSQIEHTVRRLSGEDNIEVHFGVREN